MACKLSLEEITFRVVEEWEKGAIELYMQV
jgi:hypothetical protein